MRSNEIENERFEKLVNKYFEKHDASKITTEEHARLFLIFQKAAVTNILPHWLALELVMPCTTNFKFSDFRSEGKIIFDLPPISEDKFHE